MSKMKEKAEICLSKGKLKDALTAYEEIGRHIVKDARVPLRIGDIHKRLGDSRAAVDSYRLAADIFARQGFIVKAIAVCKMILDTDPSQDDVQRRLAWLYSKRGLGTEESGAAKKPETSRRPSLKVGEEKLPRTPLFSDFRRGELIDMVRKVQYHILSPGAFVFHEGAPGDSIYVISSGMVEIIGSTGEGDEMVLATLKEGDFFGEFGFFAHSRRRSAVRATVVTGLLEIRKGDLNEIIKRHPRVSRVLVDFYKERVVDRLMAFSPVFRPLTQEDRRAILDRLTIDRFAAGTNVVNEAERGDKMYLIKSGRVYVWTENKGEGRVILAELEDGDFFGEIALTTARPRIATVTAITDTEVVTFSEPMVRGVVKKYPGTKKVLQQVMKDRIGDILRVKDLPLAGSLV